MIWELRQVLLFIHIWLAITWVGGILFVGWGVYPAVRRITFMQQRQILLALMQWSHKFLTAAGGGVVMTGVLLGTVFGPVSQWHDLWGTRYGTIWVAALLIGVITLLWGVVVGYQQTIKVCSHVGLWQQADDGDKKPLVRALIKVALLESVEVFGFAALIGLMILL